MSEFQEVIITENKPVENNPVENKPVENPEVKPEVKPEVVEEKKGRGRPKKNPEAAQAANEQKKAILENAKDQYKRVETVISQQPTEPVKTEPNAAQFVSGYVLIMISEAFIPGLIAKFVSKSKPWVSSDQLKLPTKYWEKLEPLADAAASKLFGQMDPVTGFFVSYSACVLGVAMSIPEPKWHKDKREKEERENEKE